MWSQTIAEKIQADQEKTRRAAILCKADLMTQMVNEFPELQGIMGEYYALIQGESVEVAVALREHYLPKFSGDKLPKTSIGCVLALADRVDTINSIFSIGEIPTGEKDPLGLRRNAMGIIRIITEKMLHHLLLSTLCETPSVKNFILERLPAYYVEKGFSLEVLKSVLEVENDNLADIYHRVTALTEFSLLPDAAALSEANKRVKNILKKNVLKDTAINPALFELPAEKNLYAKITVLQQTEGEKNYGALLQSLSSLKEPIDQFFTDVMVEVENEALKQNRLHLLAALRALFLNVADISLLQK
jgi:glycyl-tRNA synthetase beta chain